MQFDYVESRNFLLDFETMISSHDIFARIEDRPHLSSLCNDMTIWMLPPRHSFLH